MALNCILHLTASLLTSHKNSSTTYALRPSQPSPLRQDYAAYTAEDFDVWRILFERQMAQLPPIASRAYLEGIEKVQFRTDRIPNYEETNRLLKPLTGWQIYVVPGLIPNRPFFELMQNRFFLRLNLAAQARTARLSRRTRRLSRHFRARAAAIEPERVSFSGRTRPHRPSLRTQPRRRGGHCPAVLVHHRIRADSGGRTHENLRRGHPLVGGRKATFASKIPPAGCPTTCPRCSVRRTSRNITRTSTSSLIPTNSFSIPRPKSNGNWRN